MKQNIPFLGLNRKGSELSANTGELALCANGEIYDGAVRPSTLTGTALAGGAALPGTLLYVHKLPSGNINYIGIDSNNKLFHATAGESSYTRHDFGTGSPSAQGITDIKAIGNTLIILYDSTNQTYQGINYFLCKKVGANYTYKYIGQKPPFVTLVFNPVNTIRPEAPYYIFSTAYDRMFQITGAYSSTCNISEEYRSEFSEAAYALINRIHNEILKANCFYAPFWVRYCYRMYDGTCIMHSAPIYIPIGIKFQDFIRCHALQYVTDSLSIGPATDTTNKISIENSCSLLQYKLASSTEWTNLNEWSDIITSLDVYFSPQIARTKQDELFKSVSYNYRTSYTSLSGGSLTEINELPTNAKYVFADIPIRSDEEVSADTLNPVFYKVHSFSLNDTLPTSFDNFPLGDVSLENLTAQDRMKNDDYKTHNIIIEGLSSSGLYIYNRRLHAWGVAEQLFQGFLMSELTPYYNDTLASDWRIVDGIVVYLSTDDGQKIVNRTLMQDNISKSLLQLTRLFYPDSRAYKMHLFCRDSNNNSKYISFDMQQSTVLNGAFTVSSSMVETTSAPYSTIDNVVPELNKLYVSDVDNPFYFSPGGRKTIGVGNIVGVATVTAAISQGQYGYHDLLVFCTDGIWTLTVTKEGTYSEVHTLSREVCVNPASICQLDQSVLFASDRALSRLMGSAVTSVSDALDGPITVFGELTSLLPGFYDFFKAGHTYANANIRALLDASANHLPIKTCQLLYDFANERILVLSSPSASTSNIVYVLSLRDMAWSTMLLPAIRKVINSYPYPYIQLADGTGITGSILCLDKAYSYAATGSRIPSLIVTRTLTFSTAMKVIQGFEQLHTVAPLVTAAGTTAIFLYGSNDAQTWKFIGNSSRQQEPYIPGRPFRFFRLAVYTEMLPSEKYYSVILDIIEKYQKL